MTTTCIEESRKMRLEGGREVGQAIKPAVVAVQTYGLYSTVTSELRNKEWKEG